jgi:Protein of unknown function (DUF3304)
MKIKNAIYKLQERLATAKPWQRALVLITFLAVVLGLGWKGYDIYLGSQRAIASIVPYNHTDVGVEEFYVDDHWGGNSYPQTGGGSSLCCVTIPRRWHPDLKVTIKWQKAYDNNWYNQQVSIQKYDEPGELQVHFLDKDEVRVVITNWDLRSPNHPLHKEFPWQ